MVGGFQSSLGSFPAGIGIPFAEIRGYQKDWG